MLREYRRLGLFGGLILACLGATKAQALERRIELNHRPLHFEQNVGQAPAGVDYLAHGSGYAITLSQGRAAVVWGPGGAIALDPVRTSGARAPAAELPLTGEVNYLIGNDPHRWLTGIDTYGRVRYGQLYPGVDLLYYGTEGRLEYDFVVAAHARAERIGLRFSGADTVRVQPDGTLTVGQGSHTLSFEQPVAYQRARGRRVAVRAAYRLDGDTVRFAVGRYDHSRKLIIDPVLSYFSYLGGNSTDVIGGTPPSVAQISGQAAAVDAAGDLYVAGYTTSPNFPTQSPFAGAPAKINSNLASAFVTKFAPDGKTLIFSTYFGGTDGSDYGYGIAVDGTGNAFVVGQAGSSDFPSTAGAYLRICSPTYVNSQNNPYSGCGNNNGNESFIVKLSSAGSLMAATFIGGTHTLSAATAVAVDSAGRPHVAGTTLPGEDIPAGLLGIGINQAVGFQTTAGAVLRAYPYIANQPINGALQYDAYLSVFDASLTTLLYSTLIGDDRPQDGSVPFTSQASTAGLAVSVDGSGNSYLGGWTVDSYLPTTAGALVPTPAGCGPTTSGNPNSLAGRCGFVAKFSSVSGTNGPALSYATYLGGYPAGGSSSWEEMVTGIAADAAGDAYVVGYSNIAGYPTTSGAYQTTCNGFTGSNFGNLNCNSIFVSELNPAGSMLLASSYFGCVTCSGDGVSTSGAIGFDSAGNVYISGFGGNGLPVVNGFSSNNSTGGQAPFVAEFNAALTTLKFSSFIDVGNAGQISPGGLALDSNNAIYIAGSVNSPASTAATSGAFQSAYGGGSSDGFVAKLVVTDATSTALKVAPTAVNTGAAVTFTATVTDGSGGTTPTGTVTFNDGSTALGSATLDSSGVASFTTSTLAAGNYAVAASYGGDAGHSASASSVVNLSVSTPPPQPTVTLSVSPTSITLGQSTTLTWSSTNATSCTASGSWSGTQATSGTSSQTPASTGSLSYSLACTGAGGTTSSSATLTVNAASGGGGGSSGSHGGGGAFGWWTLLVLALVTARTTLARGRLRADGGLVALIDTAS
ncbi:MAG: Ig-like domain repeat protein [Gammaproteobacteria bacterium]|nr:Ig-like domain repeat protein [Gammaproteobacteria bacterium]